MNFLRRWLRINDRWYHLVIVHETETAPERVYVDGALLPEDDVRSST